MIWARSHGIPIGRPIANTQIYILDDYGQPVPVGVTGELYIGGVQVARGYLNRPELTAERFIADPFGADPDARMYKTGDLGRWLADGNIEYLGRNDFQVKIRGFRIELGEIEAKLAEHEGVREAVVIAREDSPGQKHLVAYVVVQAGVKLSAAELRSHLAGLLPEYMVPSAFVNLEGLPLTPNGKLDRRALPAPGLDAVVTRRYEAPQGVVETAIARVWQELLNLDRVGRHDHFFELGGHSLMAVQVVSRLRLDLGVEVGVRDLFAQPTVAAFAQVVAEASQAEQPIHPVDRTQLLPLSWAQQRLWFLDQLDHAAGAAYHIPAALRLRGTLNCGALQATLDRIVARHENLRTSFVTVEGVPTQRIAPETVGFALTHHDLRNLDSCAQQSAVDKLSAAEVSAPFDLASGPLIRGQLLRLAEDEHILLVTQHHIISDGWSIGVLVREVSALYSAFSQEQPDPLPALMIQYADYAVWQRERFQGEVLQKQIDFWREHLKGAPALLELPTDRPRPSEQSYRGSSIRVMVSAELTAGLRALSQRHGSTLFMTLLGAWSVVLSRLSGQPDVVIGTPVANRQRSEIEPLIGFFVNTLPLRVRLEEDLSVAQLLAQIKATTLDAYSYQDLPFEQMVEALQPTRSLSHSPLFQTMLMLDNTPSGGALRLPGLTLSSMQLPHSTTQFDLTLTLNEAGELIAGALEYASDLFDASTVERMVGYFERVLAAMVEDDAQRLGHLSLLSATERHQVLVEFNATKAPYPSEQLVHQLFEEQVVRNPQATAVVYEDEELSYAELNARANQLAHHLIGLGVGPDALVGICVNPSLEMMIAVLGILKAGAAYVPFDPAYPNDRLAFMLADAKPMVLLAQRDLQHRLPAGEVTNFYLDTEWETLKACPSHNPDNTTRPNNLAYIIYTSGSTGKPKGVALSHLALVNLLHWSRAELPKPGRASQFASLSFDASFCEMFTTWQSGGTLFVASEEIRKDIQALAHFLAKHAIEAAIFPAAVLQALIHVVKATGINLPHLKEIISNAEALVLTREITQFLDTAPSRRLHNHYGPSETHVVTCYALQQKYDSTAMALPPIGRPIANTQIYILDDYGQPVPVGVTGELYIGGVQVARGYLNRPELTAERFIADPFGADPDARMYKTGDLGRWLADGNIEYLGRNDFQVKIRGFRIELGEIEAKLAEHEGVREAVVIAREDSPGQKHLVAYVVVQAGVKLSAAELRSHLAGLLPEYMVPSAFVNLEGLPLTPNGKLDRRALPAPGLDAVVTRRYEAPQGVVETAIARVWQELLNLDRVGRHDHFFELGGHSLMAVQVVSRLRLDLGVEVGVRDLFAQPTVAAFAQVVAEASQAEQPIHPVDRTQLLPLSWAQQRLWFLDQLDHAAGAAYHIPAALRLRGTLNCGALQATLDRIVARHENLRTSFVTVEGVPTQRIAPETVGFALTHHDLRNLDSCAQQSAVDKLSAAEVSAPFDLASGPLIRGQLLRLAEDEHILLVTQHHIISDGWSIGVLVREVSALYSAFSQEQPDPLPALMIQYADYAVWQRERFQGEVLQKQIDFWREHLKGAPALLELPTDRPRPSEQSYRGSSIRVMVSAELTAGLRALSQRHGSTLFMTLLGAWSVVLSRLSGQPDVVIGTPVANRQRSEIEPLIGFFVNTLPLRVRLEEDLSVAQLLAQIKATTLDAYSYQDLPFEQMVEALQPTRSLSHSPLFQTMLVLDNTPSGGALRLPGLTLSSMQLPHSTTQFDLTLTLNEAGELIAGALEYASDLFDASTVERMVGYFERVLAAMVEDDAQRLGHLSLLSATERHQVLVEFNATKAPYPSEQLVHQLFEEQVVRNPQATAVVYEDEELSYAELNARANQLAHHLIGLGVGPDDRVAICVERSLEMVVGLLGILKAGGAYVPLDPSYPAERLAYMLLDSAPVALLTQVAVRESLPAVKVPLIVLDGEQDLSTLTKQPDHNPDPPTLGGLNSHHLAYVIYTSGSTGTPKGVMVEHSQCCPPLL